VAGPRLKPWLTWEHTSYKWLFMNRWAFLYKWAFIWRGTTTVVAGLPVEVPVTLKL
jgi:hypothetical protein